MITKIHLKAPDNWINDPNGFIYYKENYHLFFQYFPYAPRWGTMHWGHAVSKDLVSWEYKPVALFPTRYEDMNGCFSGSAVEKDGKMYLFYTGVRYEEVNPEDIHLCMNDRFQASQLMISSEDGFLFDNFHGKQVVVPPITDEKLGHSTHTRDPKVWRGKDAWYMVLGSMSKEEGGKLLFYKSKDLSEWAYINQVSKDNKWGWMWECPDYFETEGNKVLIMSPMGLAENKKSYENQSICMCVDFDEQSCDIKLADAYQFIDYGMDLYAPQSTTDRDGRRVMVAWVRMPKPVDGKWSGMFCMPRVVEVEKGHIYFRLHPDLKAAFSKKIESVEQADEAGYCIRLDLTEGEYISVGGYQIFCRDGKISTERSAVFDISGEYQLEFETPKVMEGFHLDIYVERNLVEVYINDGEYVISNVVYGLGKEIKTDSVTGYSLYTIC